MAVSQLRSLLEYFYLSIKFYRAFKLSSKSVTKFLIQNLINNISGEVFSSFFLW